MTQKKKNKIKKLVRQDRAKFNFATCQILRMLLGCKYSCGRERDLRKSTWGRTVLNFRNGEQKIDKEMDIANILFAIRNLKKFMKMILDYN